MNDQKIGHEDMRELKDTNKIKENSIFKHVPPNDLEIEQRVIGCILLEKEGLSEAKKILGKIGSEAFYDDDLRMIYRCFLQLEEEGKPIEILTVKKHLKGKISASFFVDLYDSVPTIENLDYYLNELRNLFQKRQLYKLILNSFQAVNDGAEIGDIKYNLVESLTKIETEDKQEGMSAWDSLNTPLVENPSPVEGLLVPERYAIVAATDGEGKTLLLIQLSLCAATGTPFLGRFRIPKPVKVLYFCGENSRDDINQKLRKQIPELERLLGRKIKKNLEQNFILVYPEEVDFLLDKPQDRPIIDAYLKQHRPDIVIFDPLNDFVSSGKSLNDDTIARETGKALNKLAREYNCCPILVTHFKKKGEDEKDESKNERDPQFIFERFHGSKYWTNIAVTQIAMVRWNPQKLAPVKRVYFKCKTVTEISSMLLLRDKDSLWYEETSRDEFSKAKLTAEDLANFLQRKGTADTVPTIFVEVAAKDLDCSKSQVWQLLKLAKKKGLVKTVNGVLQVTDYQNRQQKELLPRGQE